MEISGGTLKIIPNCFGGVLCPDAEMVEVPLDDDIEKFRSNVASAMEEISWSMSGPDTESVSMKSTYTFGADATVEKVAGSEDDPNADVGGTTDPTEP